MSDDIIELLKSGRVDNSLLCELAVHPDFPRLMADLEIYVNGIAGKQVQSANAIVDTMSATIMKQYNPGLSDPQLRQLIAAHIDDDSFCRYVIQQDINGIALDLREAHKDDFFSVPEDNPLEDFLQTAEETASPDSDPEQVALAFICKRLKLNLKKLSEDEKKWLKKIAQKSDLTKKSNPTAREKVRERQIGSCYEVIIMERNIEYIQLFMEYESDDMPMVYFYEVDVNDDRFALRAIEIFVDRTVKFYNDLYCDVVEVCPIPTVDELNEKVWGEGFYATIISKGKFDEIWNTGIYNESLTAT